MLVLLSATGYHYFSGLKEAAGSAGSFAADIPQRQDGHAPKAHGEIGARRADAEAVELAHTVSGGFVVRGFRGARAVVHAAAPCRCSQHVVGGSRRSRTRV